MCIFFSRLFFIIGLQGIEYRSLCYTVRGFQGGVVVKNLLTKQEIQVWSLDQYDPLEKKTATHSSILAWKILWQATGYCLYRLQSMGSQELDMVPHAFLQIVLIVPSKVQAPPLSGDRSILTKQRQLSDTCRFPLHCPSLAVRLELVQGGGLSGCLCDVTDKHLWQTSGVLEQE